MTSQPSSRRGANLVAAGILLSRLSGLVREVALGQVLGAGAGVEAFRAAFRIPNLMQNLLGEGVLSASFIPTYRRLLDEGRDEDAGRLAGAVAGLLMALTGFLIVVGVAAAAPLTRVLAPGFPVGTGKYELAVTLVRILTPGIGVLVLSAWCLGILNSHRNFFLPYVAPVIFNVVATTALVVAAIRGFTDVDAARALAIGVVIGSILQLLVQLPTVRRLEPNLRLSLDRRAPGVAQVLRAFGPVVSARGVVQLSAFVDLFLASFLATGGFAAISFAQVLYVLPISLFGMSIAAAELPELSSMDRDDARAALARVHAALERVAFYVLPVSFVFLLAGDVVIAALFPGFTSGEVEQIGAVLALYSLALVPTTASRVVQSLRYGLDDTRGPARASMIRVAVSTVVAGLLMFQLDQFSSGGQGLTALGGLPATGPVPEALRGDGPSLLRLGALAFGIAATAGAWIEYLILRRRCDADIGRVRLAGGRLSHLLVAAAPVVVGAHLLSPDRPYVGLAVLAVVAGPLYLTVTARLGVAESVALVAVLRGRTPLGPFLEARRIQRWERDRRSRRDES